MYDIKNLNIWKTEPAKRQSTEYMKTEIAELNLSVRSYNCLRRAGCNTIEDVLRVISDSDSGLRNIRNLGSRSESKILEKIQEFREQFHEETDASDDQTAEPIINRKRFKSARKIWDANIEEFHLSGYALRRLRDHGIRQVKDLYATNPKNEPGWYAVRELFEKIPFDAEA